MTNILEKTINNDLSLIANRHFNISYIRQIVREIALSETGELSFDYLQSKYSIPKTTFYEYLLLLQNIGIIHVLDKYNKNLTLSKRGPNKYYLFCPFFYNLYLENNVFHQGKIYESLLLMHLEQDNIIGTIRNHTGYIRDKEGEIDFYIPEKNQAYELKTKRTHHNELFNYLTNNSNIKIKQINIDELFDLLYEIKLIIE